VLRSERIVLATGSEPSIPAIPGLAESGYSTNRDATTIKEVPGSAIVLGGGPVGIELAQMLQRFGAEVHLIESSARLLDREEPAVGELVADALQQDGIDVRVGLELDSVSARDGRRLARLSGGAIEADVLIVATGRTPRVEELGLERVGLDPGDRGIEVDEQCRAGEGIWAVGDVTGVMPFTHVAKYQAQIAVADIAGETARADYTAVPRVVFSDPGVAAVGMTEAQARAAGIDGSPPASGWGRRSPARGRMRPSRAASWRWSLIESAKCWSVRGRWRRWPASGSTAPSWRSRPRFRSQCCGTPSPSSPPTRRDM
jgi:pyruvate/2-oxoglutarate dehydrogenase complex dihydrolipoamide dehydrogenase (E3) component